MNRAVLFFLGFIFGIGFYAIVINTKIKFVEMAESKEEIRAPSIDENQFDPNGEKLNQLLSTSDALLRQALNEINQEPLASPSAAQSIEKAITLLHQAKQVVDVDQEALSESAH